MRRVARSVVLVLAATLVLGAAPAAHASDSGLRKLVDLAAPVRQEVERDVRSVGTPPTTSVSRARRHLRRAGRIYDRVRGTVGGLREGFVRETAQTAIADEGRGLILDGLRDLEVAFARQSRAADVAADRLRSARSEAAVRRAARAYESSARSATKRAERGFNRAERGGRLIVIAR